LMLGGLMGFGRADMELKEGLVGG
jgi:hypothetical protein